MTDVTGRNFGLLIAYVLPGFVSLCGMAELSPVVKGWLLTGSITSAAAPTVGGFLYLTLASVTAGLTASTIRWAVIDRVHHATGIEKPAWNDAVLQEKLDAFEALVENHYRYYQFYANMVVALVLLLAARLADSGGCISRLGALDGGLLLIGLVYWAGSRDALRHYYTRAAFLLGTEKGDENDDEWT
jgi:hypothetical protein